MGILPPSGDAVSRQSRHQLPTWADAVAGGTVGASVNTVGSAPSLSRGSQGVRFRSSPGDSDVEAEL